MSRRGRRGPTRPDPPDGYYWLKPWINLRGGGYSDEWKLARVVCGRVQVLGMDAVLDAGCPYLEFARWVWIDPPHADTTAVALSSGRRRPVASGPVDPGEGWVASGRVRRVAEGIVDAFLRVHESAANYYVRHPEHRADLAEQIARLIERVRG